MKKTAFMLTLAGASLVFSGFAAAAEAEVDGKALIESKCSLCHTPSRALDKTADKAFWEETVKRMQSKLPERISDEDVKAIVNYLSTHNVPK